MPEKKNRIPYGLLPNRGGSPRVVKKPYCFFEKVFLQRACRIILQGVSKKTEFSGNQLWQILLWLVRNPFEFVYKSMKSNESSCKIVLIVFANPLLLTILLFLRTHQRNTRCFTGREWPPHFPDHSPNLNFCLWGFLKSKVYSPRPAAHNQLQANISGDVAHIDPAMMRRAMLDNDMRERAVIAAGGGHFEKWSSDQLYPCLVRERCLMRS